MVYIQVLLIGFLAFSGAMAQVPSYTVTYTDYSKSIFKLFEYPFRSFTHCKLINGLYDVAASTNLTIAQNTIFYEFITNLETTVIKNTSIMTKKEKLFYSGKAMSRFSYSHPLIFSLVNQRNITEWSTLSNFISITNSYNLQTSLNLIVNTDFFRSTKLFDLITGALFVGNYNTELIAFQAFWITEVEPIIIDYTLLESVKFSIIYKKFIDVFFYQHYNWYLTFYDLDFGSYGSFYQVFQNMLVYYQKQELSNLVLGTTSECQLLIQLNKAVTNQSLPFPRTVRAQIKHFYNALLQAFELEFSLENRLVIINKLFGSFVGLQWNYYTWFQYVGLGNFGNFYQLVCYISVKNIYGNNFPEKGIQQDLASTTVKNIDSSVASEATSIATSEATSEATSVATSEATSVATSEATSVATSEATSVATSEATSVATSEVTSVATSEATSEVTSVATSEVTSVATSEATSEVTSVATSEATSEVTPVATSEVTSEATSVVTNENTSEATSETLTTANLKTTTLTPPSSTQCHCMCF